MFDWLGTNLFYDRRREERERGEKRGEKREEIEGFFLGFVRRQTGKAATGIEQREEGRSSELLEKQLKQFDVRSSSTMVVDKNCKSGRWLDCGTFSLSLSLSFPLFLSQVSGLDFWLVNTHQRKERSSNN